ncbi:GNAT family N-acetyltransferase [Pendulispora brunnea]|uniref:GNAT family N-acetyltransferase n=1 Tax=Pendulispora brunnea TaxID=2905690 RepID=A0ABZ2K840_9BACT
MEASLTDRLERKRTRYEWCFVLTRRDIDIGRVGFQVEDTCPAAFLGDLPAREAFAFGLWLPWDAPDYVEAGRFLIKEAIDTIRHDIPEAPQMVVNRETSAHPEKQCAVFEALGAALFQEKQGFTWTRGSTCPPSPSNRLVFETIEQVGPELYCSIIGRVGEGTLDRNDAWYRARAGEMNWAKVFMTYFGSGDEKSWLVARQPNGDPVGMVAVSPFDDTTATIVFIGVVPKHRGNGYIDDLVRAGTLAADARGYASMLSDADVLNRPMTSAFERNGHRDDVRPWHRWHYRL